MRLKDRVAMVTGGAKGIGLACARRFAQEGAKVAVVDLDEEAGERAVEEVQATGADAIFVACDVGDKRQVDGAVERTVAAFNRLDCAVANAGIVHAADFLELEEADFDRVLRVNLKGVFLTGQAAARQMVRQGSGGAIVNMSSVQAVIAVPQIAAYVTSKGGINGLTRAMALSLVDHGIRVNAVGPGSIMTEVLKAVADNPDKKRAVLSRTPMGRIGEPDEVAKVAVFLASDDSSYITGQTIYPDGGRLVLNYVVPVKDDE